MVDILHVIPFLWSGAGKVLVRLCQMQRSDGWRVGIVTSGAVRGQRDWPEYRSALADHGVRHWSIDFFSRDPACFWPAVDQLRALVSAERPRVIHTHAGVPACAAAAVRPSVPAEFDFVAHLYSWGSGRPSWMDRMDLSGLRQADQVVCSARHYRQVLLDGGVRRSRIRLIPWGVDPTAAPARPPRPHGGPVIGFVGRLEPRKRQADLVDLAGRLQRRLPGLRLELIGPDGDAEYASRLRADVARRRLERCVRVAGKVRLPLDHVKTWDLFVSLSQDEGQGLSVLEAMEAGTPVAATVVPGVEDYLSSDGAGFRLEPDDAPAALADRIHAILIDTEGRRAAGRQGRALVHRRFGWPATYRRIMNACRMGPSSVRSPEGRGRSGGTGRITR